MIEDIFNFVYSPLESFVSDSYKDGSQNQPSSKNNYSTFHRNTQEFQTIFGENNHNSKISLLGDDFEFVPQISPEGDILPNKAITRAISYYLPSIPNFEELSEITVGILEAQTKAKFLKIVHNEKLNIASLVFDVRHTKDFVLQTSLIVETLNNYLIENNLASSEDEFLTYIFAWYANADLSIITPDNDSIRKVMKTQRDKNIGKLSHNWNDKENLIVKNVRGTQIIDNFHYKLPSNMRWNYRCAKLLCDDKSLNEMASVYGLGKLDGFDFSLHDALYYYQNNREKFIEYNGNDSNITLYIVLNFLRESHEIYPYKAIPTQLGQIASSMGKNSLKGQYFTSEDGIRKDIYTLNKEFQTRIERELGDLYLDDKPGGYVISFNGDEPKFYHSVDSYDIKGAYQTIQINENLDISDNWVRNPKSIQPGKYKAGKLASKLNFYKDGWLVIKSFNLGDNVTPNECLLRVKESKSNSIGYPIQFKGNGNYPVYSIYEIEAIAGVKPNADIEVYECYLNKSTNADIPVYSLSELQTNLQKLRNEVGRNTPKGQIYKKIGNTIYGKTIQDKAVENNNLTHDIYLNDGGFSTLNKEYVKSPITNTLFGMKTTAICRSSMAFIASHGAIACQTDSIILPSYKSKDIFDNGKCKLRTGYRHIDKSLEYFTFDLQYESKSAIVIRANVYTIFDCKYEIKEKIANKVPLTDSEIASIDIIKSKYQSYPCNSKLKDIRNREKFKAILKQYYEHCDLTVEYNHLTTPTETKLKNIPLCTSVKKTKIFGCENTFYGVVDELDIAERYKLKQQARSRGYADSLSLKINEPGTYQKLKRKINVQTIKKSIKILPIMKRYIGILVNLGIPCRAIEECTNNLVSKSSASNYKKMILNSNIETTFEFNSFNEYHSLMSDKVLKECKLLESEEFNYIEMIENDFERAKHKRKLKQEFLLAFAPEIISHYFRTDLQLCKKLLKPKKVSEVIENDDNVTYLPMVA